MKKVAVAFALILAAFALAACGSCWDNSSSTSAETTTESEPETGGARGTKPKADRPAAPPPSTSKPVTASPTPAKPPAPTRAR